MSISNKWLLVEANTIYAKIEKREEERREKYFVNIKKKVRRKINRKKTKSTISYHFDVPQRALAIVFDGTIKLLMAC